MSNTDNLPAKGDMDLAEARAIAIRSLRLLDRIVVMAEDVIGSTPREVAVQVFAHDQPADVPALKGKAAPRGRVHPLLALIRVGLASARVVKDLVRRLFPELMNEVGDAAGSAVSSFEEIVSELRATAKQMGLDPDAA